MLAALFVDGTSFLDVVCSRDARPCKLALCLILSLGFTGVCGGV